MAKLTNSAGLPLPAQVRLLLLRGLHRPFPRRGSRDRKPRILPHHRRSPHHRRHLRPRAVLGQKRKLVGNGHYHRKSIVRPNAVGSPRLTLTPVPLSPRPRLLLYQALPHVVRTIRQGGRLHTRTTVIDHVRCAYNMPTHHYCGYCNHMHAKFQPRIARQTDEEEVADWRRRGAADAAPCGTYARAIDYRLGG